MGGDVVLVAEDGGQCQHAVPHGVVAVFQRHAGILGELGQGYLVVRLPSLDVERFGLDDGRDGRQHGYHHLLAVAKAVVGSLDAEAHTVDGHRLTAVAAQLQVELAGVVDVA